jgi:hypothetical protein
VADSFNTVEESVRVLPSAGARPMRSVTAPEIAVTENPPVQGDFAGKEERVRPEPQEHLEEGRSESESQRAPGAREQEALDEQLAREPPRACAERRAKRHLPPASH